MANYYNNKNYSDSTYDRNQYEPGPHDNRYSSYSPNHQKNDTGYDRNYYESASQDRYSFYAPKSATKSYYGEPYSSQTSGQSTHIELEDRNTRLPFPNEEDPNYKPESIAGDQKDILPIQNQQKYPFFLILMTALQLGALIWSFVLNQQITGSFIQTNPFNYMIGPSTQTLIFLGGRFVPCMRQNVTLAGQNIPTGNFPLQCPMYVKGPNNSTICTLNDMCGLGGFKDPAFPDQGVRFLIPIFLHGGLVHFLFNMMFQVRTGFDMEKQLGWWRVGIIYFVSGLAGFLFGASFAPAVTGVGASGALFGLIGTLLLDLFYNWSLVEKPVWELIKMVAIILITFFIGTLPFIDNFAHVGGFMAGILTSLIVLPPGHLRSKKYGRWLHLGLRIGAIPILALLFVYFTVYFYSGKTDCVVCQYVNCIPGLPWCEAKFQSLKGIANGSSPPPAADLKQDNSQLKAYFNKYKVKKCGQLLWQHHFPLLKMLANFNYPLSVADVKQGTSQRNYQADLPNHPLQIQGRNIHNRKEIQGHPFQVKDYFLPSSLKLPENWTFNRFIALAKDPEQQTTQAYISDWELYKSLSRSKVVSKYVQYVIDKCKSVSNVPVESLDKNHSYQPVTDVGEQPDDSDEISKVELDVVDSELEGWDSDIEDDANSAGALRLKHTLEDGTQRYASTHNGSDGDFKKARLSTESMGSQISNVSGFLLHPTFIFCLTIVVYLEHEVSPFFTTDE
ncbi:hypothetical protein HK098_002929 [Nowakowskiella sp. JEL0407]|nr:hypothetical protein HK098_002929 [Nowakowskiella sp. JEL0407]